MALTLWNAVLTIVTLGIYRFWAKTNVRRHIWRNVNIDNEPLEYTGTGLELFLGFLVILVILILPFIGGSIAAQLVYGPNSPQAVLIQVFFALVVLVLYGMAIYRAQRYRLSRTLWRGIHFGLAGSSVSFTFLYLGAWILQAITFGWSTPAMNLNIQERLTGDMRFGNEPFRFRGTAGPLYGRYAICWFAALLIPIAILISATGVFYLAFPEAFTQGSSFWETLEQNIRDQGSNLAFWLLAMVFGLFILWTILSGIIWSFYNAKELRVFADYTRLHGVNFSFDATAGSLIALFIGNVLIIFLTLGFGRPFVTQRIARYFCDRMTVTGDLDYDRISQSVARQPGAAEGLVEAFDIDAF